MAEVRRIVVAVAAAAMVMLGGVLSVTFLTRGNTGGQLVNGNVVEYAAGHRPLAPDLTATALTGSPVRMSSYRGKVLVLNFWASWCSPCRREAPVLQVAYQQYHAQGVDFLGDDMGDTAANALSFIHSESIGYPSISDPGYAFVQQFSQAAPVNDPPTTAVIDKTGHVAGIVLGPVNDGELAALIHKAALMG